MEELVVEVRGSNGAFYKFSRTRMCATELQEINWDYTIASEFYQDCLDYLFFAQSKRSVFAHVALDYIVEILNRLSWNY